MTTLLPSPPQPAQIQVANRRAPRWFPVRYRVPLVVTASASLLACVGFLLLPLAGTDLSAQVARGHFFNEYGAAPIDFRWYGGIYPFGYSLLTGPANALLGSRGVGAVSCVVSATAFAWLLTRLRVPRPTWGGVAGALVGVANLVSGRTTFAIGLAFGMLALCALAASGRLRWRLLAAAVLAMLATAGSPVAGAFVMLAGATLVLVRRWPEGLALGCGAGVAMLPVAMLFRDGGIQPYSGNSMRIATVVCIAVFFLVPRDYRAVRIGAALAAVAVVLSFYLPNPLGSNIIRLPMLFAVPLVAALAAFSARWVAVAVAAIAWLQPPLIVGDLNRAGAATAQRLYYQPLIDELSARGPVGRVEVVPLGNHWESTYVGEAVPLARGWLRQVDADRNRVFYDGSLNAATYVQWLYDNAVEYVALARGRIDMAGRSEAALISAGLPYLQPVWENADWTLYGVVGGRKIVSYPAELVESGPTGVRFSVPARAEVTIRVRWSRWLVLHGPAGCVRPATGSSWVVAELERGGDYELTSGWDLRRRSLC